MFVIKKALSSEVNVENDLHRENSFHTRVLVSGKVCLMKIDAGSCANVISAGFVSDLAIPTTPHPQPYTLQGLSDVGQVRVTKQALISFNLGRLDDEVLCDVAPMPACHIILGRPWQYDRRVTYDGYLNSYALRHKRMRLTLRSLSSEDAHKDQLKLAAAHEKARLKRESEREKALVEANNEESVNIQEEVVQESMVADAITEENEIVEEVVESHVDHAEPEFVNAPEFVDEKLESVPKVVNDEAEIVVDKIVRIDETVVEEPVECSDEHTEVLDTPSEVPGLSLKVVCGEKPVHCFMDPFDVRVDDAPTPYCSDYIASTPSVLDINLKPLDFSFVALMKNDSFVPRTIVVMSSVHFIFDPGISLLMLAGCSRLICDAAQFYDVLLIRGRILSNREGMM